MLSPKSYILRPDKLRTIFKRHAGTYIVQHNAHKDIERNAEEVHDGASGLLWNVLGPHLHNGWPEYAYTSLKGTEAKKLERA